MSYVALANREYGEGRLCIFTDRIGGYRTGHGDNLLSFWRTIFEWTGQKKTTESIHVGVIESYNTNYEKRLSQIPNVLFESINLKYIATHDLSKFDLLYFIGLPEQISTDVHEKLEPYVESGYGILVETPDRGGEPINVLISMDSVYCSSYQRPSYSKAYWTTNGLTNYTYTPDVILYFMTTLESTAFSNEWSILMSDIPITFEQEVIVDTKIVEIETIGSATAEFGVSFISAMQKGLVEISQIKSYESSESSSSKSLSSVSSSYEPFYWSVCDNRLAQWKMNENYSSNLVWDSSGNFNNMGYLVNGILPISTASLHTNGKINGAFNFNSVSTNERILIQSGTTFNFTDGIEDTPFSICVWIKPSNASLSQTIIGKNEVWSLVLNSNCLEFYSFSNGHLVPSSIKMKFIETVPCIFNDLWHFVVVTYDGSYFNVSVNTNPISFIETIDGYTIMSDVSSETNIGVSFKGEIDNLMIFDRSLYWYEIEGLWERGNGTEKCNGVYAFTSSSSSNSSVSSDSTIGSTWSSNSSIEINSTSSISSLSSDSSIEINSTSSISSISSLTM